jgi:hypothetical protein
MTTINELNDMNSKPDQSRSEKGEKPALFNGRSISQEDTTLVPKELLNKAKCTIEILKSNIGKSLKT